MCLDNNNNNINNNNNSGSQSFLKVCNISLPTRAGVTWLPFRYWMKWGPHSAGSYMVCPTLTVMYFSRGKSLERCSSFAGASTLSATDYDCSSSSLDVCPSLCCRFPQPDSLSSFPCAGGGGGDHDRRLHVVPAEILTVCLDPLHRCLHSTEGPSQSLWESPHAREREKDIYFGVHQPGATHHTASICNCHPRPNSHQHLYRHVGVLQVVFIFYWGSL